MLYSVQGCRFSSRSHDIKVCPNSRAAIQLSPNNWRCFSKHKIKLRDLRKEDCKALLPLPLPSESDLSRALKRNLYPTLSVDDLRQTKYIMLQWESAPNPPNPEFDLDGDFCTDDRQYHDDSYSNIDNFDPGPDRHYAMGDML
jgi:hypothetical protein